MVDVHDRLHQIIQEQRVVDEGVARAPQDIEKCFDAVNTDFAIAVAESLTLPTHIASCISCMSAKHQKRFVLDGCLDKEGVTSARTSYRSLGCLLGHDAEHRAPTADIVAFLDDRTTCSSDRTAPVKPHVSETRDDSTSDRWSD